MRNSGSVTGQSKTASLTEACVNIAIGFALAVWMTKLFFPALAYADNLKLTCAYTAVSLVRAFALRRAFNWFTERCQYE